MSEFQTRGSAEFDGHALQHVWSAASHPATRADDTDSLAAPRQLRDTGLDESYVLELLVKVLYVRGRLRLPELVNHLCLPGSVLEPLLSFMRAELLCEMNRRGDSDATIAFTLTELGRVRARDFLHRSQYAGPAPVTLEVYNAQVRRQSVRNMRVSREHLQRAFAGVVIAPPVLEQFGAAMNSGGAVFVFGPAGSGKTYIAERLVALLSGRVAVPHAVVVDGETLQIFDPLVHRPAEDAPAGAGLDLGETHDRRWVMCERPVVRMGAELTLDMVDLEFDPAARFYKAPPQLKANNGLFIIDDLGRQLVPAQALMNRWIVPLDRGIDYLALHSGTKFLVPFDLLVVFSTNLRPADLADEAFLRRLPYKIRIGYLEEDAYRAIFRQVCEDFGIPFDAHALDDLLHRRHAAENRPLLACLPRDLLQQVRDRARYLGLAPRLDAEALDWAWNNYFAKD